VTLAAIPLYLVMFDRLGLQGLAVASVGSIGLYALVLAGVWHRRSGRRQVGTVAAVAVRSVVAAAAAAAAAIPAVDRIMGDRVSGVATSLFALGAAAVSVGVVYLGASRLLGAEELRMRR
jgi:peptidoglycan biosynthesis protein MviN/MurJ (putative lipid II flippase)